MNGSVPLFVFDAPAAGTGKSELAREGARLFAGDNFTLRAVPTDDSEWEKALAASLRSSSSHIIFDNANQRIKSGKFDNVLTSGVFTSRVLGTPDDKKYDVNCIFAMTMNNAQLHEDTQRRAVTISIDAKIERPEERQFPVVIKDYLSVPSNLATMKLHALTIIAAWVNAKPAYTGPVMGSFEAWSKTLGGILQFAGVEGFLANREAARNLSLIHISEPTRPY